MVRFQTSFGGGKTHGLIAAYHLANGARPLSVGEFVDPDLLPDECRVAAVAGDTIDGLGGTQVNGRLVRTMWGAIAAQLGDDAWDLLGQHDETRSAPGTDVWEGLFKESPTLVILDEVAAHLRGLASSGDPDLRRQAESMPAFLLNLFTAAARVDTVRVVITLATESDAFARETADVVKILDPDSGSGRDVTSVLSRFSEVLVPAQEEEISEILRRRLFAAVDESAAAEAADAFSSYYSGLEKRELRLGFPANIGDRVRRSYPLHPELIRVLDDRVGTIPEFQRTRGALRLLAESVASLWAEQSEAVTINVGDVPLAADPVGYALTFGIGRDAFAQVLEADVAGEASHAAEVDLTRFVNTKPFTTRSATVVFLHSLEQTASRGATHVDVFKGVLAPGDDSDLVEEALRLLDQSAWHLDYDGARWRFDTEPNPRKIIEDEKAAVMTTSVREELDRRLRQMFASHGPMKTRVFPAGPGELDDRPELQLGVIHYESESVTASSASPPLTTLVEMLETHGVAGSNRTYRNGVVFLVADSDQINSMRESVRWDLAAQRVRNDTERMQSYAEPIRKKLKDIADRAGLDARVAITRCYRHLYYPKADKANHHLRHHELPPTSHGDQEKNQTKAIQQVLEGLGKIRSSTVSTDFFAKVAGFPATNPISTSRAAGGFWRDHDSDIILNPTILPEVITAGIKNGAWVYYDSDSERAYTADSPPPSARVAATAWLYTQEKAQEEGLLTREPTWADVERELNKAKGQIGGVQLRSALEKVLGSEPAKAVIGDILARVVRQEPTPIVVTDGEPTSKSKPLPPSSVTKLSLDRLQVLTGARAEKIGIEIGEAKSGFKLAEQGAAGPVFGSLRDKLSELGKGKKITQVEVSKVAAGPSTAELKTMLSAISMLPKHDFTVGLNGSGTFADLSGEVNFSYLSGASADFRKVEKDVFGLFDKTIDLYAELSLAYKPESGIDLASPEWEALASTFSDIKPGEVTVTITGT